MQFINDAPVANSQQVTVAPLKLGSVVVSGIGIGSNLFDFPHNTLLPAHRRPGKSLSERSCCHDCVHQINCYLG